eukprot:4179600-Pyramimonas_sp.AAC.1
MALEGAIELQTVIEGDLGCAIAIKKAAVVASVSSIAKAVRQGLGSVGGAPCVAAVNLSIDDAAGRPRRVA